ncbi:MAG: PfkB family carbohydrate kinase [candidate division Zixibacteria bacterium]|nr:PfkB family carbohydrate kinase [candidate division Zixibacteria bacterium]
MKKARLTIIGTINQDSIRLPSGRLRRSYGGILYNILPLAQLAPESLIISPVCNLGYNIYNRIVTYLRVFKNINLKGINKVSVKNNHVYLYYSQRWNKTETLKYLVPEIEFSQIEPFLDSDLILVNFISGFDISLDCLKRIRRKTKALIFIDVHSLLLGIKEDGKRFFRVPNCWEEYLETADIVQMNFKEIQVLSGSILDSDFKIKKIARKILNIRPEILIVTKGEKGALLFLKNKNKITRFNIGSFKVRNFTDPTGCGDVFSSGFIFSFLKTGDAILSTEFASFLAGRKSRFSGIEKSLALDFQNY